MASGNSTGEHRHTTFPSSWKFPLDSAVISREIISFAFLFKKHFKGGAWVAQSVERLTLAQVCEFEAHSGLSAVSTEPA